MDERDRRALEAGRTVVDFGSAQEVAQRLLPFVPVLSLWPGHDLDWCIARSLNGPCTPGEALMRVRRAQSEWAELTWPGEAGALERSVALGRLVPEAYAWVIAAAPWDERKVIVCDAAVSRSLYARQWTGLVLTAAAVAASKLPARAAGAAPPPSRPAR